METQIKNKQNKIQVGNIGQCEHFKNTNDRLIVINKALDCLIYKRITNLGILVNQNLHISKPW